MDGEINSTMETDGSTVPETGVGTENVDSDKANLQEAQSVFKKPALLAAPSLTSKRNCVSPPSRPLPVETKAEDNPEVANQVDSLDSGKESKSTDTDGGGNKDVDKDRKHATPVKVQSEKMHRVLHPKGPSAAQVPPLKYTEPSWGGDTPDAPYSLEILKNGAIVDTLPLTQRSYYVVGRLPVCDVTLEHPSISRYHAVIQYRSRAGESESAGEDTGFYIHDLGSTHGTVVNKNKIPPKTFIRLRVGHVLKFGGSTRLFILQVSALKKKKNTKIYIYALQGF